MRDVTHPELPLELWDLIFARLDGDWYELRRLLYVCSGWCVRVPAALTKLNVWRSWPLTLAALTQFETMNSLVELGTDAGFVTDAQLRRLALTTLRLRNAPRLTNASFSCLDRLNTLELEGQPKDVRFEHLSVLTSLTRLCVNWRCGPGSSEYAALATLTRLRSLSLCFRTFPPMAGPTLSNDRNPIHSAVSNLPLLALERLELDGTTFIGNACLSGFSSLTALRLRGDGLWAVITNEGVATLTSLARLDVCALGFTPLSFEHLPLMDLTVPAYHRCSQDYANAIRGMTSLKILRFADDWIEDLQARTNRPFVIRPELTILKASPRRC